MIVRTTQAYTVQIMQNIGLRRLLAKSFSAAFSGLVAHARQWYFLLLQYVSCLLLQTWLRLCCGCMALLISFCRSSQRVTIAWRVCVSLTLWPVRMSVRNRSKGTRSLNGHTHIHYSRLISFNLKFITLNFWVHVKLLYRIVSFYR